MKKKKEIYNSNSCFHFGQKKKKSYSEVKWRWVTNAAK